MAIATMRVPTIFSAVDRFSSVVGKMTATTANFGRTAEAAAMRTSRKFSSAGTNMLSSGVTIAAGLGLAVNEAVKFEKAMATVSTTIDNTTPEMMKQMGEEVLQMSKKIPKPISELTEALYDVVSAGIEGSKSMVVLNSSGRLAVAGLGTTQEAVDVLTSSINSFNIDANNSEDIANKVFKAVKYGKTTVSQLAESFGSSSALVKNSNVSLEEYLATTAVLTTTGMTASRAQTQVASAITALIKPSKTMQAVFDNLGVKDIPTFIKNSKGLIPALEIVRKKADEMGILTSKAFGRKEGFSAMLSLLGPLRSKYDEVLTDMTSHTDTLTESVNKQQATTAAGFQRLKNNITILAIRIGDQLLPAINKFVDDFTPMIENISGWIKRNLWLATTLMTVAKWLLILGAGAKILSVLFYGISKAIGVASVVMRTYSFLSTLAALSNVSLGTATMGATKALLSYASAQLAMLGPLALAAGALGVLALAYKVVSDATRTHMYTTVDSYKKNDSTIRYSTIVMESEFDKQYNLMKAQKDRVNALNGVAVNVGKINLTKDGFYNSAGNLGRKVSDNPFVEESNKIAARTGFLNTANTFNNYSSIVPQNRSGESQPQNVSGQSDMNFRLPKIGGELKITVNSADGSKATVDDSQVRGIPVKVTGNQGFYSKDQ